MVKWRQTAQLITATRQKNCAPVEGSIVTSVLESHIDQVLVYREGALVTRLIYRPQSGWPETLLVDGLPLALQDESVRAQMRGLDQPGTPPCVVEVEARIAATPPEQATQSDFATQVEDLERQLAELRSRQSEIEENQRLYKKVAFSLPAPRKEKPPQAIAPKVWRQGLVWLAEVKQQLSQQQLKLRRQRDEVEEILSRAQRQLAEAQAEQQLDPATVRKQAHIRLRLPEEEAPAQLLLSYWVPGARWRPSYVLRVQRDGTRAELALRALVSQHSGEKWDGVRLALSTAQWQRQVRLPELKSVRIGRQQPSALARAWREAPEDTAQLFASLDQALATLPGPMTGQLPGAALEPPEMLGEIDDLARDDEVFGDAKMMSKQAALEYPDEEYEDDALTPEESYEAEALLASSAVFDDAPMMEVAEPAPMMSRSRAVMPPPSPSLSIKKSKKKMASSQSMGGRGMPGHMAPDEPVEEALDGVESFGPKPGQLDYQGLYLSAWDQSPRGNLRPLRFAERLQGLAGEYVATVKQELIQAQQRSSQIENFHARSVDVTSSAGAYDYSYEAKGRVTVPGDGKVHNVPVLNETSAIEMTLVVVPREDDQAVRVASLANPLHSPVLSGPVEVYLEREFLVDSQLSTMPPGGRFEIGLGVEPAVKVARNTHYKEETQGLLGGGVALQHHVEIEVSSRLSSDVTLELRERIPVCANDMEKEIKIQVLEVDPPWEDWNQSLENQLKGGKRWRLPLPAGASQKFQYRYVLEIDNKDELVGGNRREEVRG